MTKKCLKCKVEKDVIEFWKNKTSKDKLRSWCKFCSKEHILLYRIKNKAKIKKYREEYTIKNKELIKLKYNNRTNSQIERRNKLSRILYKNNKERHISYVKKYVLKNKGKVNKREREYKRNKIKNDPFFKLKKILRSRTRDAFTCVGKKKNTKTEKLLGISFNQAKSYIENKFTSGMMWKNHGEWHIDHIIPLASARTEEEVIRLCHYTNLQPLWAEDNLKKSDKIYNTQLTLTI